MLLHFSSSSSSVCTLKTNTSQTCFIIKHLHDFLFTFRDVSHYRCNIYMWWPRHPNRTSTELWEDRKGTQYYFCYFFGSVLTGRKQQRETEKKLVSKKEKRQRLSTWAGQVSFLSIKMLTTSFILYCTFISTSLQYLCRPLDHRLQTGAERS